ncbi:MAG TPA: sulfurtransferase [bacterium]|nr:sulfurtransferase [bacterium]
MEASNYDRQELLADPEWLDSVRDDPDLCIVDCSGGHGHTWAYIPGAVALPVHFSLKDPDDPLHVVDRQRFAQAMGQLGITKETTVVLYDRHGGMAAARVWWVLTYYGHAKVRVLNGGWHRWRAEGWPVSLNLKQRPPARFSPHPNQAVLARVDYVLKHLDDPDVQVLDVRNQSEWAGHNPWGNRRTGHIPGAMHWEWINSLAEDERRMFRPADELRAGLSKVGITPEHEVITHCQAGIRASQAALVLTLLGFPRVRNFDGSMKEWANSDSTPMENGAHGPV